MSMARLKQHYREKIVPELQKNLGLTNVMQVPRITKITVNMGVGEAVADKKIMDNAVGDMTKITGQKPLVTRVAQVGRDVQGARRAGHRLQGHAARREHV